VHIARTRRAVKCPAPHPSTPLAPVTGLAHMHAHGVVHLDVCARNLLVCWDEAKQVLSAKVRPTGLPSCCARLGVL
jgi:hypothetical protein